MKCHKQEHEAQECDIAKVCKCGTLVVDVEGQRELINKLVTNLATEQLKNGGFKIYVSDGAGE